MSVPTSAPGQLGQAGQMVADEAAAVLVGQAYGLYWVVVEVEEQELKDVSIAAA